MMTIPLPSVVIPAHNEEQVLGRCLRVLLVGSDPGELEVIVVANACSDRTADIARAAGVQVIETDTPGKANALRIGDEECTVFPRIYADADVDLDYASARALVDSLNGSDALAAAPAPIWDLAGASRPLRRVHSVHEQLMAPRRALAGVGVYVLTERGHSRIFPLPEVLSDDGLVDRSFEGDERIVVTDASVIIRPARTVRAHLRRRIRVRQGGRQLDRMGIPHPRGRLGLRSLAGLVADRAIGPIDAAYYLTVLMTDRVLARLPGRRAIWATDTTSRGTES